MAWTMTKDATLQTRRLGQGQARARVPFPETQIHRIGIAMMVSLRRLSLLRLQLLAAAVAATAAVIVTASAVG